MKALLSIDNSEHSRNAVFETARGCFPENSELLIVSCVSAPFGFKAPTIIPESVVRFVDEVKDLIKAESSTFKRVETKVLLGDPRKEIIKLVEQEAIDLLILGSRKPDISKILFGSVSHQLLLSANCAIRIARGRKAHNRMRVLIGVDRTVFSKRAVEEVTLRPWPDGTEFICLNAVPTLTDAFYQAPYVFAMEDLERDRQDLMRVAVNELGAATELIRSKLPNCTVKQEILHGEPREALVRATRDYDADLMVLGSSALNFDAGIAVGSVSENVALSADCSVEVIKRKSQESQAA